MKKVFEYLEKLKNVSQKTNKDIVLNLIEKGHRNTIKYIERKGGIENCAEKDFEILRRRAGIKTTKTSWEQEVNIYYSLLDGYNAQFHDEEDKLGRDLIMESVVGAADVPYEYEIKKEDVAELFAHLSDTAKEVIQNNYATGNVAYIK